ncbi:hypothetical protein C4D60_Mb10t15860 [Musa balbisiana]|uniref:Histidine-containing phosphotransfer protein n=1 Tax=Musa balbisiana TaxID=52838 RepID=A0A4S8IYV2_MUSBA|nr:hypothetical protein C4D60_Mb10t15860 [Musa balbisiana]
MDRSSLQRQLANLKKSLFDQGNLDEQFYQLEELQDDASPNFVEEVVTLFFRDSSRLVANIEQAIEKCPRDYVSLDALVHQLKDSASSIGAAKMMKDCTVFREYCDKRNFEGCQTLCLRSFQKVKNEHSTLRQKLENYFQLLRQVGPAEKATRSGK